MRSFVIIAILSCLAACQPEQKGITGLWKLESMMVKDSLDNWSVWRDGMNGYLLYDGQGHVSLTLSVEGYEDSPLHYPNFDTSIPIEALKHRTGYYSYVGNYSVDEELSEVTHQRLSHSNPKDWGKEVTRKFSIQGDSLIIVPKESENASLRLTWTRAK